MHQLVLRSSAGEDLGVSLRRSFHDHFFGAADSSHVLRERRTFDDDAQSLKAIADFDGVAELIDHVGRFCPFTWRKDEGVRGVVFRGSSNFECAFEILFGFAGVTHDDVGRDRKIGNSGTSGNEFFEITLCGVPAMHQREHPIAAGLQWEMQVSAHRRVRRHRCDCVFTKIFGMGARESHAINAIDVAYCSEEIGKERSGTAIAKPLAANNIGVVCSWIKCSARAGEISAVRVHVLSKQGDFPNAVIGQALNLGEQLAERAADLATTNCRNDAVGTGVVTTDLNGDPGGPIDFTAHCER